MNLTKDLTEEELDEIVDAYYENQIETYLHIFFYDLIEKHIYWVSWGRYKGKEVIYQERDDWGLIYGSIEIEKSKKV